MKHNLTISITDDNASRVSTLLSRLNRLPFATRVSYNVELSELTVLCEAQHAAAVEDVLAAFV